MRADREQVARLLKTARGQIDGIIRMVEDDRYCIDISNQLLATESILRKTNREVIHAHMEHCVKEAMETGDSEEKLKEVLSLIDKLTKYRTGRRIRLPVLYCSDCICRISSGICERRFRINAFLSGYFRISSKSLRLLVLGKIHKIQIRNETSIRSGQPFPISGLVRPR